MDKWINNIDAWKDYGLILLIICLFTGILAPMALIKWGLIAWVAANLWKRWKAQTMRDITKNRFKRLLYVLIVIGAFWLGHYYGEQTLNVIDEVPVPKITIEMPEAKDELDILEEELAAPEATEEIRG